MHNLMVAFDGSPGADVALRQAIVLAEGLASRLHILRVVEPLGPAAGISLEQSDEPLAILDRLDAMTGEDHNTVPSDDDELAAAVRLCEDSGVHCVQQRLNGFARSVIREQCMAMDLLILGRRGNHVRKPLGAIARSLVYDPVIPTLLCRDEVAPWRRLLLAYRHSPSGGRALKLAGELASALNLDLDVLVAEPTRHLAARSLAHAAKALRPYHVEGESLQYTTRLAEALQGPALELQSSVVILPREPVGGWWRSPSPAISAATKLPGALALVVP